MINNHTRSVYVTLRCDVPENIPLQDFLSACDIVINYNGVEISHTLEDAEE